MLLVALAVVAAGNILCVVAGGPTSIVLGRAVISVNAGLTSYYALLRGRGRSVGVVDCRAVDRRRSVACAVAVVRQLVEDLPTRTRLRVDVEAAALLATGLAALVAGICHGDGWAGAAPASLGC